MSQRRSYNPYALLMDTVKSITGSTHKWAKFLTSASNMYKYPFADKVMIYAQRPNATACAEYDQWRTQFNRYVRRNANGIMLIDNRADKEGVRHIFDVADTGSNGNNPLYIWSIRRVYETPVLEKLLADRGIALSSEGTFFETLRAISYSEASQSIAQVFSYVENTDIDKDALQNAFYESVAWMVLSRCGLNASEYIDRNAFEPILQLKDFTQIHAFGSLASRCSSEILRTVERTVKSLDGDRAARQAQQTIFDALNTNMLKGEKSDGEQAGNEHGNGTGILARSGERPYISEAGGRLSTGGGDGRGSDSSWNIRADAERIFAQDRSGRAGENDSNRRAVPSSEGDRSESDSADGSFDGADGEIRGCERGTESERSDGMGRPDEQHPIPGGGNRPSRSDLRIANEPPYGGFFDASILTGASIPLSVFDTILRDGSNSVNGKLRITAAFQKDKTVAENALFLQKEYGVGGKGFSFNGRDISVWFHADGMTLANGRSALASRNKVNLSWEEVAIRISDLLDDGTYLVQDEMDMVVPFELKEIAGQIWELEKNSNIDFAYGDKDLFRGGFPDSTERISERLGQSDKRTELAAAVQALCDACKKDPRVMRFRFDNPFITLQRINDLNLAPKIFSVREYQHFEFSSFITEDEIDTVFRGGGSFSQGKFRIYSHFLHSHTPNERIDFLKKEYGHGGRSHAVSHADNSWEDHSPSKGILLRKGGATVQFSWKQAVERIRKLIISGKYMSQQEIEYLPQYEKEELAGSVHSFFFNAPLTFARPYVSLDHYERRDEILKQLDDPNKVSDIIAMMQSVMEATPPDDRRYSYRQDAYKDIISFQEGTFTLFPRQHDSAFVVPESMIHEGIASSQVSLFDVETYLESGETQYEDIDLPDDGIEELNEDFDDEDEPFEDDLEEAADPPAGQRSSSVPKHSETRTSFRITDDNLGIGGPKEKYLRNVAAIRLLKKLEADHRAATPEDLEILSRFVGWGGLPQAFDESNKKWSKEYAELQELLSGSEYEMARASTLNAHYTPPIVIKAIYQAICATGFKKGNLLEPALGTGHFFGLLPADMKAKIYGVELDSITGRIAKQLYPHANIQIKGFEETTFDDNSFHVAVGNVPFGDYQVVDRRYAKNGFPIHDYFFAKTIDI